MKKYIPLILFPYISAIDITLFLFSGYLSDMEKALCLFLEVIFILINAAELFFTVWSVVVNIREIFGKNSNGRAAGNIVNVKLIQIPAYIYIYIFGFMFMTIPLGFIFTILCFAVDLISISITGIMMTFSLAGMYRKKECRLLFLLFHSLISFVFCLDVADGIYLKIWCSRKKTEISDSGQNEKRD